MKHGLTLIEMLIVLAIISIMITISIPNFRSLLTREALVTTSHEFLSLLRKCRQEAITRNRYVGARFVMSGNEMRYALFIDGNGNGIRTRDIQRGVDPMIQRYSPIQLSHGKIKPGILSPDIPDIYDGRPINNPNDPVKFGRSNICSFSPLGACTPGTIYVTDGFDLQAAVRVYGMTALTRVMIYDDQRGWHRLHS